MGRRHKHRPVAPAPVAEPDVPPGQWRPIRVELEGAMAEGIEVGTVQTRTRALLQGDTLRLDHWWYHPAYDEEPNTHVDWIPLAAFLKGRAQDEVLERFGPAGLGHLLDLCRAARPDLRWIDAREHPRPARPAPREPGPLSRWADAAADRLGEWASLGGGLALIGLLVAIIAGGLSASAASWWWHGRVLNDLRPRAARVVLHEVSVAERDIGGGHKRARKGVALFFTPRVGFEPLAAPGQPAPTGPLLRTLEEAPRFERRSEAFDWMRQHHPLDAERTLWLRPGDPVDAGSDFRLDPAQAPGAWALAGEIGINLLLSTFVYLPLGLLAIGLTAVGILGVASLASGRWKSGPASR